MDEDLPTRLAGAYSRAGAAAMVDNDDRDDAAKNRLPSSHYTPSPHAHCTRITSSPPPPPTSSPSARDSFLQKLKKIPEESSNVAKNNVKVLTPYKIEDGSMFFTDFDNSMTSFLLST